jgi:hypothetical protein
MFRLHETTRRRVCRMAFVALCALPTLATAAWIGHWHRPWRVNDAELRLSSVLRSDVQLVDWREPRPAATRTRTVRIVVRGAAEPLVEAADVRSTCIDDSQVISIARVAVDARRLNTALERAANWLTDGTPGVVRLSVDELVFEDPVTQATYELRQVEIRAERSVRDAWKLQLLARGGSGDDDARLLRISCERSVGDAEPVVQATIDATAEPLPAWLLRSAGPIFGSVGNAASFAGQLQIETRGEELVGAARGEIHNAVLEAMLPAGSPCRIEGAAHVTLADLQWRNAQIEHLTGAVKGETVRVNRALLDGATKWLWFGQVGVGPTPAGDTSDAIAIDAVAVRFDFNRQGLSIGGDFPPESNLPPGCVAISGGRPLLMQPQYLLQAGWWVRFVTGSDAAMIPATQEAVSVAARLPLPEAAPVPK